jgi:hypothetical protein
MDPTENTFGDTWKPCGNETLDDVARSVSADLARLLLACYPGVEVRIPHKLKPTHHFVENLGWKNALLLCAYMPEDTLNVPLRPFSKTLRNDRIRELLEAGACRRDMALELGITQRHVRRLISALGLSGEMGARDSLKRPASIPPLRNSKSNAPLTGAVASFDRRPSNSLRFSTRPPEGAVCGKYGYFIPQQKQVNI